MPNIREDLEAMLVIEVSAENRWLWISANTEGEVELVAMKGDFGVTIPLDDVTLRNLRAVATHLLEAPEVTSRSMNAVLEHSYRMGPQPAIPGKR